MAVVAQQDADDRAGQFVVTFSAAAWAVAQRNAALLGIPVGDVVSQALALQKAVIEARDSGARVVVEKRGRVEDLAPYISGRR
jgi:hypothetical protein